MKALIIIDHGSKKNIANNLLNDIAAAVQEKRNNLIVEPAHMELAEPSIPTAIQNCIKKGAKRIIFQPYMLGPGRHVQEDIPRIIKKNMQNYPTVSYEYTKYLGFDNALVDLILKRSHL